MPPWCSWLAVVKHQTRRHPTRCWRRAPLLPFTCVAALPRPVRPPAACSEPTTGLDARAASLVMATVRATVNTGRTVVATIHQVGLVAEWVGG